MSATCRGQPTIDSLDRSWSCALAADETERCFARRGERFLSLSVLTTASTEESDQDFSRTRANRASMRRWGRERGRVTERRRRRETPGITQARRYKTLAPRAKRCAFAKHKHEESKEAQSLSYTRLGRRPAREVESVKSFWRPLDCRKTLICLQECFVPQRTMDLYNSRELQYER